jgi:large subunit ribosomal protein L23
MALFGSKNNKEVKEVSKKGEGNVLSERLSERDGARRSRVASPATTAFSEKGGSPILSRGLHHDIIIRPRITEKSGIMSENSSVYTFEVRKNANKPMIAQAIKALYKVTPTKVRIVNLPAKRVLVRGKRGTSNGVKKAMVYLKKGEKINLT